MAYYNQAQLYADGPNANQGQIVPQQQQQHQHQHQQHQQILHQQAAAHSFYPPDPDAQTQFLSYSPASQSPNQQQQQQHQHHQQHQQRLLQSPPPLNVGFQHQQHQQQQQHHQRQVQAVQYQSSQSPYGGYPAGTGSMSMPPPQSVGPMSGVTMQPGILQQRQQTYQHHVHNTSGQQQQQQQPQQQQSAFATALPPGSRSLQTQSSPSKAQPMTAVNPAPTGMQAQARPSNGQAAQKPMLQSPLSPEASRLESQRITALLDINNLLLREIVMLQGLGRAKPPSSTKAEVQGQSAGQQSPTTATVDEGSDKGREGDGREDITTREYLECMRRLQSNLAYLANISDRIHKPLSKIPPFPAIMDPLPPIPGNAMSEESLQKCRDLYQKLRSLFPAYPSKAQQASGAGTGGGGAGATPAQAAGSPRASQRNVGGTQ